ncbi:MAG: alkaline phosphatase family protein [Prolixibacteraceae bacterium]|nr:alkaline phosphatase family protein [Prolixibacteraceae bacterium]
MKKIFTLSVFILLFQFTIGKIQAQTKTENIILVTLDGLRWQEIFGGADSTLLKNKNYTKNYDGTSASFWNNNLEVRRRKLFPFIWNVVVPNGQLHGNRNAGSKVNVANPYQFSYPGYNEMLTGYADPTVNSNDKVMNKNTNVLEFINQQKSYKGKVAVFSTWDVFPYIINEPRSGVYVNSDVDTLKFDNSNLKLINDMQFLTPRPIDVRPDVITYMAAREYFKAYQPKVLYIAFDETDDLGHAGEYDQYLKSAQAEDAMLADIWSIVQSNPQYKNKTTLIITCDHGRGDLIKDQWKDHGENIKDSGETWIAVIGPDTKSLGEVKTTEQLYQRQYAATIAALLGLEFTAEHPIGKPIRDIYTK